MKRMLFYLSREKKKEKKHKREGQSGGPVGKKEKKKDFSLVNGSHDFQLIYKKTTQQYYLKTKKMV